jgi:uncharacterized protein YneF (UPF0154 family)
MVFIILIGYFVSSFYLSEVMKRNEKMREKVVREDVAFHVSQ